MRNSPLSKTPPAKLATIPDIINEDAGAPPEKTMSPEPAVANREAVAENPETELFDMD